MKRLTLLLSLLLVAGLLLSATVAAQTSKTHKLTAEVVSTDASAKTITVKNADGREMTARVEGKAAEALASFKAGDKVTLTCRDNDAGEHEAIVEIQKVKAQADTGTALP